MECDICQRAHDGQKLPFLCAVDARNSIYENRIKHLGLLMEHEALQNQINELLADTSKPTQDQALSQQFMTEAKTDQILAAADKLREEIKAAKEEIQVRKASIARRRSDLASVSAGLAERRTKQQKDVEKTIGMQRLRWSQAAEDMASTRAFLCTEAVRLYGLKRVTKKGSNGRYEYHLGKIPIVDLINMDSLPPEVISTSLAHIAHVLMLVSHYLAIRLPAEISLPHRDYPRPTMFTILSSYQHADVSFPGTSLAMSPLGETNHANAHVPRPRPLYVDKPLPQLSKEDPAVYSLFLEGVTLLAYDIAWLCCSQGVSIGDKTSFEDICNMGRNLYSLLMVNPVQGVNNFSVNAPPGAGANTGGQGVSNNQNWLGRYSHGTNFYSLSGADGTELIKTFKLPSPMKLADKLNKKLLGDAPAADWEVLDDDAWKEEGIEPKNLAENVGALGLNGSPRTGSSNGWMKVKNR